MINSEQHETVKKQKNKHMKQKLNIIMLFITILSFAQNPNRKYLSYKQQDGTFEVLTNDGHYIFTPYSAEVIETSFIPKGEVYNSKSHAVVLNPFFTGTKFIETTDYLKFETDGIKIYIQKEPFKISYSYNGKPIISEKRGYFKAPHEPMDFVKGNIVAKETERIEFNLTSDEVLYGAGARALGMNRRGYRLPLYNRAHYGYETHSELLNFTLPIIMSSKQYMIHFDNAPIGYLDLDSKKDNTLTYETISGRKTYQVIVGDSWEDIINNYTDLTGKQPMPPRWVLGNFSSRFGYHSQVQTEATIDAFKDEGIPVDAVILDLYWFGKEIQGTLGNFEFYKDSFPNSKQMIKTFQSKSVETILITEPYVLTTSNRWYEAVKEGILAKDSIGNPAVYDFYFGNGGIIDIYNPQGEQWFKAIYKNLSDLGVNGFWGDLGEPEVLPSWVNFSKGKADEIHNIYGHDWAKLVYEASIEANPNRRPFILMRAGYSGSQRYGLIPWSGDVSRSWGGIKPQPEIALQMGMQGLAYMHSDLGGFAGANLDDELYVRWLQYGVFQPIYRPHADENVPSEPVFRSDKAKALAKQAISLRYRFLPYNYNLVFENNQKGAPLMRPLFFEEDNEQLLNYSETYLWGNDILVSPILEAGKKVQEVYFPKTSKWFDFYSDENFNGGQTKSIQTRENSIPTFVRAGAFILMAKPMQSTEEYKANNLQLHYYNDASIKESKREFYNDDGLTKDAFEKGQYEILEFEFEKEKGSLEFEFKAKLGKAFSFEEKQFNLIIHNIIETPKRVKFGHKKVKFLYDSESNTLNIPIIWNTSEETELKIKLKQ